jgi:hypothetical protein
MDLVSPAHRRASHHSHIPMFMDLRLANWRHATTKPTTLADRRYAGANSSLAYRPRGGISELWLNLSAKRGGWRPSPSSR